MRTYLIVLLKIYSGQFILYYILPSLCTMRYTFAALAVSLLIVHLHRTLSEDVKVKIFNKWPRRFYGRTSIALEDERMQVEEAWQVTVTFSKPVAESESTLSKTKFWNAQLPAGRRLKFRFLGHKANFGERRSKVSAEFTQLGDESGSGFWFFS